MSLTDETDALRLLEEFERHDTADSPVQLTVDEAERILRATGAAREKLLAIAARLRDEGLERVGRPGVITFSKKVFLPITNMCRDRCHYCTFVKTPAQLVARGEPLYMPPEQVLAVAAQGAALGCKEALFTLGDRPEDRWPEARAWLNEHGYSSTLDYVRHMATLVRERTGMLPHLNPGVMTDEELAWLRPVAPSMGMMLETTSVELWSEPGRAHYGSPDKDPALRLEVIENAGRHRIPFTTGILVGIGESVRDRAESLIALREQQRAHGHIQEIIVQNFRAKPQTAMRDEADLDTEEYLSAIATARLVMGRDMRIQVPPNLADQAELEALVAAGIDDWGGVSPLTADHVNPERPWPSIVSLREKTAAAGFELTERLTAYPPYLAAGDEWIDPALADAIAPLVDPATGLGLESARPTGRDSGANADPADTAAPSRAAHSAEVSIWAAIDRAREHPEAVTDADLETMLLAEGDALDAVTELADLARRYTVGEVITYVVNATLDPTRFAEDVSLDAGLDMLRQATAAAVARGATEICVQGRMPERWGGDAYLLAVDAIKETAPGVHLHAYRPDDMVDAASRLGIDLAEFIAAMREHGVSTFPGTGVKMLDEQHRRAAAPADLPIGSWVSTVQAAHRAGLTSTSVAVYGTGESPHLYVRHLRSLTRIQAETGGFSELVVMPAPGRHVALLPSRSELDEHRARMAVARLAVNGAINRVQTGWTRIGLAAATDMLRSGANDLGGLLLGAGNADPGSIVGGGAPHELSLDDVHAMGKRLRRPIRERTTSYGSVANERST